MIMSVRQEAFALPKEFSPSEFDAIVGWARQNFGHAGNRRLREIIAYNVPIYESAKSKGNKGKIIVDLTKQLILESPSRTGFVKLDANSGRWFYIGFDKAKDKIGHALRKAAQFKSKKQSASSDDMSESRRITTMQPQDEAREKDAILSFSSQQRGGGDAIFPAPLLSAAATSASSLLQSETPLSVSLPRRRTKASASHLNEQEREHQFIIGDRTEREQPPQEHRQEHRRLASESSPVRRNIFDSPMKALPQRSPQFQKSPPLNPTISSEIAASLIDAPFPTPTDHHHDIGHFAGRDQHEGHVADDPGRGHPHLLSHPLHQFASLSGGAHQATSQPYHPYYYYPPPVFYPVPVQYPHVQPYPYPYYYSDPSHLPPPVPLRGSDSSLPLPLSPSRIHQEALPLGSEPDQFPVSPIRNHQEPMHQQFQSRSTRMIELQPIHPSVENEHDNKNGN